MIVRPRAARRALVGIVALAWLAAAATVLAHAELEATFPADGAMLAAPPDEVAAVFDEALRRNSTIELVGPDGEPVATGGLDPADDARLVVDLPTGLAPGAYEARWTAFSGDDHLERGTFRFTVLPPTLPPVTRPPATRAPSPSPTPIAPSPTVAPTDAPTPPATPAPSPAATPTAGAGADALLPIAAAIGAVGALGLFLVRRRGARTP